MYLHFHPYQTSRLRNGPSKQATSLCVLETPHSSSFPKNLELLQQSLADGWTSATFTIRNMLADHLTRPRLPAIGHSASCHSAISSVSFATHTLPFAIAICCCHLPLLCAIFLCHLRLPLPLPFGLSASCNFATSNASFHEYPAICHCHYHLQLPLVTAMCAFPLALAICCYRSPLPFFRLLLLFLPH